MLNVALPVLKAFRRSLDSRSYNGASLLGLRGIVLKSHGSADVYAFECALSRAVEEVRTGMLAHITERMAKIHAGGLSKAMTSAAGEGTQ